MVRNISYGQLRKILLALGCRQVPSKAGHWVFEDQGSDLLIVLPAGSDDQLVRPVDLHSVRRALWGHGLIGEDEESFDALFLIRKGDRLIWKDPATGQDRKVVAAAGESDGLVVVRENGSLVPCPVEQVRRIKRAATPGGK